MIASLLCLGLFFWLLETRSRLKRAELQAQDESLKVTTLTARLNEQSARLQAVELALSAGVPSSTERTLPPIAADVEAIVLQPMAADALSPTTVLPPTAAAVAPPAAAAPSVAPDAGWWQPPPDAAPAGPDPLAQATQYLRELLFGGNTVVRAGIVVLLVGVVLLLRWAAEHSLFPIELRLGAVALLAFALVSFGFQQRHPKPGFALTLQGGGVAALYLVVFFAFRSYGLLPPLLAFGLLLVIALSSGVLAVVQDGKSLIFIGQLFGFAAPLLVSTGSGSHIALFSYYLLLNTLVFAVAFFKAWRALNLLGFAFTFGVGTIWGGLHYEPQLFASTEPFLIAFFALYTAIPVLFALRHPGALRGWVDGSLVFGTPLAALALQWALVHDRPFGMAYTAVALGAVYLGVATLIKRTARIQLAALGEAFLPIGIGFATLAIPYAVDSRNLTGAAWALEGAGLYWVGVRQQRALSRAAGVVLQLMASAAVLLDRVRPSGSLPVVNSWALAGVLLGSASLFVACYAYARRSQLRAFEWQAVQLLVVTGVSFWLRSGFGELDAWIAYDARPGAQLLLLGVYALVLETLARRLDWLPGRIPALLLWPAMAAYLARYAWWLDAQPLSRAGWLGWPVVLLAMLTVLRKLADADPPLALLRSLQLHALTLWLWTLWLVTLTTRVGAHTLGLDESFGAPAGTLTLGLVTLIVLAQTRSERWPFGVHRQQTLQVGVTGLVLLATWRVLAANLTLPGSIAPLPYVPLLNALDLSTLLELALMLIWLRRLQRETPALCSAHDAQLGYASVAVLAFVWWNAQLARTVHQYAGAHWNPGALFHSSTLQLAFSLSWTTIALSAMVVAYRKSVRIPWIVSAVLLAVVVVKLFAFDLVRLSTPTKIVSFLGVGALLLLVGYVAPVPPRRATFEQPRPGVQP